MDFIPKELTSCHRRMMWVTAHRDNTRDIPSLTQKAMFGKSGDFLPISQIFRSSPQTYRYNTIIIISK
jgi:hypothetical protein